MWEDAARLEGDLGLLWDGDMIAGVHTRVDSRPCALLFLGHYLSSLPQGVEPLQCGPPQTCLFAGAGCRCLASQSLP